MSQPSDNVPENSGSTLNPKPRSDFALMDDLTDIPFTDEQAAKIVKLIDDIPETVPVGKPDPKTTFQELEGIQPYAEFVKTTFAWTTNVDMVTIVSQLDTLHCILGLVGELIELENEAEAYDTNPTPEQLLQFEKEVGDCCYYFYMFANVLNMVFTTEPTPTPPGRGLEDLLDGVKKMYFYKHTVDLQPFLFRAWCEFKSTLPNPVEYYINQNREKLTKRYPQGKFSSEHAASKLDNKA